MADQSSRGGKKRGQERQPYGKRQGVRPGTSAAKKERGNKAVRTKLVADR